MDFIREIERYNKEYEILLLTIITNTSITEKYIQKIASESRLP